MTKFDEIVGEAASLLVSFLNKRSALGLHALVEDISVPMTNCRYGKAQYAVATPVPPDWLSRPVEYVVRDTLAPIIAALVRKLPEGVKLIGEDLELPKGMDHTAMGRHAGVSVRGICSEMHIKGPSPATWLKNKRLYDISLDEFVTGPASDVLRFDVVERGHAQMSEARRLRLDRSYEGVALTRALART